MASALRSSILRHVRVPISKTLTLNGSKLAGIRFMSSHDDHLDKEAVVARVLGVVKSFPKVDPAKVFRVIIYAFLFLFFSPVLFLFGYYDNAYPWSFNFPVFAALGLGKLSFSFSIRYCV